MKGLGSCVPIPYDHSQQHWFMALLVSTQWSVQQQPQTGTVSVKWNSSLEDWVFTRLLLSIEVPYDFFPIKPRKQTNNLAEIIFCSLNSLDKIFVFRPSLLPHASSQACYFSQLISMQPAGSTASAKYKPSFYFFLLFEGCWQSFLFTWKVED